MSALLRHIATRCGEVWRGRGPRGFLTFAATRLLLRREDLVFSRRLSESLPEPAWPDGGELRVIDAAGLNDPLNAAVLAQVLRGESSGYAEGLVAGDLLFAHIDKAGTVDTFGFVIFASAYKRFLGIDFATPMIGNCNTLATARGRGLYPALLLECSAELARRGYAEAVITCSPDNAASIRGITKAGFSRLHHLVVWIALSRLVLARRVSSKT